MTETASTEITHPTFLDEGRRVDPTIRFDRCDLASDLLVHHLITDIDLQLEEHNEVCGALTTLLADLFALYMKTKVFHWHASGPGFRCQHLLLADQADQILATIDTIGERVGALGGTPVQLIGEVSRLRQISDVASVDPTTREMLAPLLRDTRLIAKQMRRIYALCGAHSDFVSASLLEDWIDEAEGRYWFLFETHRDD